MKCDFQEFFNSIHKVNDFFRLAGLSPDVYAPGLSLFLSGFFLTLLFLCC